MHVNKQIGNILKYVIEMLRHAKNSTHCASHMSPVTKCRNCVFRKWPNKLCTTTWCDISICAAWTSPVPRLMCTRTARPVHRGCSIQYSKTLHWSVTNGWAASFGHQEPPHPCPLFPKWHQHSSARCFPFWPIIHSGAFNLCSMAMRGIPSFSAMPYLHVI